MIERFLSWLSGKPFCERSGAWPAVRAAHLEVYNCCAVCLGTEKLEVHHKKPYHLFPELELDRNNLITLCERNGCHFLVGHCRNWQMYNPTVVEDANYIRNMIKNRLGIDLTKIRKD